MNTFGNKWEFVGRRVVPNQSYSAIWNEEKYTGKPMSAFLRSMFTAVVTTHFFHPQISFPYNSLWLFIEENMPRHVLEY